VTRAIEGHVLATACRIYPERRDEVSFVEHGEAVSSKKPGMIPPHLPRNPVPLE
jgi:hypothetical protein